MYTVGMAYCGSGNNKAIRRLLHVAVSVLYFFSSLFVEKNCRFITPTVAQMLRSWISEVLLILQLLPYKVSENKFLFVRSKLFAHV